jgi:hypothetical protein
MAFSRNKLEQAFKQFQMQQAMQELEMRKDMLTLEKQKADLAFKHSKYTLSDLFGGTTTDTVGNKDAGMAGGEEYAVPTGEPTKEVSRPLNLQELIQKFTQSDVPVDIAAKAIPFLTMMQKEKEKPMAVGKHIYKPDTNEWIQNPYVEKPDKESWIDWGHGQKKNAITGEIAKVPTAPRESSDDKFDKNLLIAAQIAGIDPKKVRGGKLSQAEATKLADTYKEKFGTASLLQALLGGQLGGGQAPTIKYDAKGNQIK